MMMHDEGGEIRTNLMDFATERLAVGEQFENEGQLRARGITHVINCRLEHDDRKLGISKAVKILWLPQDDDGRAREPAQIWQGIRFALEAMKTPGAKVLSHCHAGINRGPTMGYAILRALGWPKAEAIARIRFVRPITYFNETAGGIYVHSVEHALENGPPELCGRKWVPGIIDQRARPPCTRPKGHEGVCH